MMWLLPTKKSVQELDAWLWEASEDTSDWTLRTQRVMVLYLQPLQTVFATVTPSSYLSHTLPQALLRDSSSSHHWSLQKLSIHLLLVLATLEEPCKTLSHLVFIDLVFKPCGLLLLWLFMWRNGGTNNIKLIWIQDLIWPVTLSPMFLLDLSWITTNEYSRSRRKAVISR